jgi:hypothetical protein
MIGFYSRGGKCLQRGTNWFLIKSRLRFVSKSLSCSAGGSGGNCDDDDDCQDDDDYRPFPSVRIRH